MPSLSAHRMRARVQLLLCAALLLLLLTAAVAPGGRGGGVHAFTDLNGGVGGRRTLVILEDAALRFTHSDFLAELQRRGHALALHTALAPAGKGGEEEEEENGQQEEASPAVALKRYGEFLYDNIVVLAPGTAGAGTGGGTLLLEEVLTHEEVMDFLNAGGKNMLVAGGGGAQGSDWVAQLMAELGVDVDPRGSAVVDHFRHLGQDAGGAPAGSDHTAVLAEHATHNEHVLGAYAAMSEAERPPVVFRGAGHSLPKDSNLHVPILVGNPTSYSTAMDRRDAGMNLALVSGVQARNNARVVYSGSTDLFSNDFFRALVPAGPGDHPVQSGNAVFTRELGKWALGELGVLRWRDVAHSKADGTAPDFILHEKERPDLPASLFPDPEITKYSLVYRIKDFVRYNITIEEWDAEANTWKGYQADDIQLEFIMLDPYVRTTLTGDEDGRFSVEFQVPDTYGIYKFRVMYRREGVSTLQSSTQVAVRPFKHNEYERYIHSAMPYYFSAFSMMAGFFVFSCCFLYAKDEKQSRPSSHLHAE